VRDGPGQVTRPNVCGDKTIRMCAPSTTSMKVVLTAVASVDGAQPVNAEPANNPSAKSAVASEREQGGLCLPHANVRSCRVQPKHDVGSVPTGTPRISACSWSLRILEVLCAGRQGGPDRAGHGGV